MVEKSIRRYLAIFWFMLSGSDAVLADAAQDCAKLAGDDAIRACDQVIDQDSLSANAYIAYYNRGLRYRVKGDLDRAIADFTLAIEIAPKFAAAYANLCWLRALANRDLPLALADCDVAIRLAPLDPAAISARGYAYYRLNRFDEAITDYDSALKLDPMRPDALHGRGLAKLKKGDKQGGDADVAAAEIVADRLKKSGKK